MAKDLTSINVSLPRKLKSRLERKLKRQDYASASEYVRDLIRKDLLADAIEQVDQLLLEGLNSGPGEAVDENWWRRLRAHLHKPNAGRA